MILHHPWLRPARVKIKSKTSSKEEESKEGERERKKKERGRGGIQNLEILREMTQFHQLLNCREPEDPQVYSLGDYPAGDPHIYSLGDDPAGDPQIYSLGDGPARTPGGHQPVGRARAGHAETTSPDPPGSSLARSGSSHPVGSGREGR